jgi:hypothetical protein
VETEGDRVGLRVTPEGVTVGEGTGWWAGQLH